MLTLFIQSFVFISFAKEVNGMKNCIANSYDSKNITCEVTISGTVCLVCPIPRTDGRASWYFEDRRIYRSSNALFAMSISLHYIGCHSDMYSLAVVVDDLYHFDDVHYICKTFNSSYGYYVKARVNPRLFIMWEDEPVKERMELKPNEPETFYCQIYRAIAPLNLVWLINDFIHSAHFISDNSTAKQSGNYNVAISLIANESISNISCLSFGPYIMNGSAVLQVSLKERKRDERQISLTIANVWIAFTTFMVFQLLLIIYFQRNQLCCRRSEVNQTNYNPSCEERMHGGTTVNGENTSKYMEPVDNFGNTRGNPSFHGDVNDGRGITPLPRKPTSDDVSYIDICEYQRQIVNTT